MVTSILRIAFGVVGVFIAVCVGCSKSPVAPTPTSPSQQTPTPPPNPPAPRIYSSITVFVRDALGEFLADAVVGIVEGPGTGMSATTTSGGRVVFEGTFPAGTPVTVQAVRAGFSSKATLTLSSDYARVGDITLDVPGDAAIVPGDYTVTFDTANACDTLRADLQSPTYDATLTQVADSPPKYRVALAGEFGDGVGYLSDGFDLFAAGAAVGMPVTDGDFFIPVFQHLAPNSYLVVEIDGFMMMPASSTPVSSMSLPIQNGQITYCEMKLGATDGWGCEHSNNLLHFAKCSFHDGRLILRPR